jgi:hypothetical protein
MNKLMTAGLVLAALIAPAMAEQPILRTLPAEAQQTIASVREGCSQLDAEVRQTSEDEGLIKFVVGGKQAVLVDELNFCGNGTDCYHGVNCATGYTHEPTIYVREGSVWRKAFSTFASEPVRLGTTTSNEFRLMMMRVFDGDWGCRVRKPSRPHATCDAVFKWNGSKFIGKVL